VAACRFPEHHPKGGIVAALDPDHRAAVPDLVGQSKSKRVRQAVVATPDPVVGPPRALEGENAQPAQSRFGIDGFVPPADRDAPQMDRVFGHTPLTEQLRPGQAVVFQERVRAPVGRPHIAERVRIGP
jgi:hypothetical protein